MSHLCDHIGSVLALVTPDGEIVESYEYEPYGLPTIYDDEGEIVTSRTSTVGNRFMFTGREWEPDGEFYHYRHRTYSPHEKRFMQRDPIGLAGGWNVYAYCGGDPVNASDPMGLRVFLAKGFLHWGIITFDYNRRVWVRYDFGLGQPNFSVHQQAGGMLTSSAISHDRLVDVSSGACSSDSSNSSETSGFTSGPGSVIRDPRESIDGPAELLRRGEVLEQVFNVDGTSASLMQHYRLLKWLEQERHDPSFYNLSSYNCRHWSTSSVRNIGLERSYRDASWLVKPEEAMSLGYNGSIFRLGLRFLQSQVR